MPGIPTDALKLRDVKYGPRASPEEQIRVAEALLEAGRAVEALDLFLLAEHQEGIQRIRSRAVERGRPILLLMLERAGRKPSAEEWRRTGEAAFAEGRYREAHKAFTEAGDEEGLARVKERIPDFEPFSPQGKQ